MYALSCGAASDVFGIHGDKVVYDDGAHGEGTESVGEGVQSVVGYHDGGEAKEYSSIKLYCDPEIDCASKAAVWASPMTRLSACRGKSHAVPQPSRGLYFGTGIRHPLISYQIELLQGNF